MKTLKYISFTLLLTAIITGAIQPTYEPNMKNHVEKKHKKEKPTSLKETKSNKPSDKKKKRSSTKIADTKSEKRRYGKHSGPTAAKKNEKIIKKHTELI